MNESAFRPTRGISISTVVDRIGRCRAAVYDMTNKKSLRFDPTFPRPFKIGRRTLFVEAEIEEWLRAQIATRVPIKSDP